MSPLMPRGSGTVSYTHLDVYKRQVVKAVYTHRALTTPQIEALLFPPENGQDHSTKTSRVRYRLKMLFQHGYLFRDEQPTKLSEMCIRDSLTLSSP